jgi:MFS family permease
MPLALGAGGVGQSAIGTLYSVGAALSAFTIVLGGRIGDRHGRPLVAFWDCLALAAVISLLLLPLGTHGLGAMVIVTAPVLSVLYGVGYPLSADGADRAGVGHGLALGMVNLVWGVGAVVGPVAGGLVGEVLGDRVAYAALVVLCVLSAVAIRRTIMVLGLPGPAHAGSSPAGR